MYQGILRVVQGALRLIGDTDGTKIGNVGDRLAVDSRTAYSTKLRYDDMNSSTGGVARNTSISDSGWTQLYSYTGSGMLSAILINFDVFTDWLIRLVIDSQEIFGSAGILTDDITGAQVYDFSDTSSVDDDFGLSKSSNNRFIWHGPLDIPVQYASSVKVYVKRKDGSVNKTFRAGLAVLTKDT
jgi:hypothetical protein